MIATRSAAGLETPGAMDGEPVSRGRGAAAVGQPSIPPACPVCGSIDLYAETAADEDAVTPRRLQVSCLGCGRHLGDLLTS